MTNIVRPVPLLLLLLLAACSPRPAEPEVVASGPIRETVPVTAYVCEDGRILRALYPDPRTAQVTLEGSVHRLTQAVSGSGARYVGEGLQWWIKGDEGMLASLKADEEIATNPGVRCVPPARAPVEPPEPGSPGGLPDDRTPLDERPARAGSAQAAYTVVETYYALVESGRTEAAAKLRADGVREDLRSYATLAAQVGGPGELKGGAGALFVEVPVVTYGRYVNGERYQKSGKVTLKRINDAPGSSAEQWAWRIVGIDLSASPPTR